MTDVVYGRRSAGSCRRSISLRRATICWTGSVARRDIDRGDAGRRPGRECARGVPVIANAERARHQLAACAQIGHHAERAGPAIGEEWLPDVDDGVAPGTSEQVLERGDVLDDRQRLRRRKKRGTEIREIGAQIEQWISRFSSNS